MVSAISAYQNHANSSQGPRTTDRDPRHWSTLVPRLLLVGSAHRPAHGSHPVFNLANPQRNGSHRCFPCSVFLVSPRGSNIGPCSLSSRWYGVQYIHSNVMQIQWGISSIMTAVHL
jgi:hypothetical protein